MASNDYMKTLDRNAMKRPCVIKVDEVTALKAQVAAMVKKLSQLTMNTIQSL